MSYHPDFRRSILRVRDALYKGVFSSTQVVLRLRHARLGLPYKDTPPGQEQADIYPTEHTF